MAAAANSMEDVPADSESLDGTPAWDFEAMQASAPVLHSTGNELLEHVFDQFGSTISIDYDAAPGKCGRSVRAQTSIPAGHVLLRTPPAAFVLKSEWHGQRCDFCFKNGQSQLKMLRCSACKHVSYCSQRCQKRAWKDHHKRECGKDGILAEASSLGPDARDELALLCRMLMQRSPPKADTPPAEQHWAAFDLLETNIEAARLGDRWASTQQLAAVCHELLSKCPAKTHQISPVPSQEQLETILASFQSNNFSIWNELLIGLGAAVFPFGAILNHSCEYNAVIMYDEHTKEQVIRAVRPIQPGEEIVHCYVDLMQSSVERRGRIRELYFFDCCCDRCTQQWDSYLDAPPKNQKQENRAIELYETAVNLTEQEGEQACKWLEQCVESRRENFADGAIPLVKATTALHTLAIENGRFEIALRASAEMIQWYDALYGRHHPMSGLQRYTHGNLLREAMHGDPDALVEANQILREALVALEASHGPEHSMIIGLKEYIAE